MSRSERPRVCLLHVGGTIGMVKSPEGHYAPQPGFLEAYLASMPELRHPSLPAYEIHALEPLRDSADMIPDDWFRIAAEIHARDATFDGFVVIHGTDTMAYTASALSFLLEGLAKPVVITGSQITLAAPRSDGREHIVTSLIVAGTLAIPEVAVYFAARLLRGNRSQKVNNHDFVAFRSGNYPPLARAGVEIEVDWLRVRAPGAGLGAAVALCRRPKVVAIRLYPGLDADTLERFLDDELDAVVLETYGAGNAPTGAAGLLEVIERAVAEREILIVNCSQCHGGAVRQDLYSTGAKLEAAGVLSGHDMTPEAALTKLYCGFARGWDRVAVRELMGRELVGEFTPPLAEPS